MNLSLGAGLCLSIAILLESVLERLSTLLVLERDSVGYFRMSFLLYAARFVVEGSRKRARMLSTGAIQYVHEIHYTQGAMET
jgi:hypothetical protein